MSANEKITLRQLQILIILGAMGTGVIVLPRRVAEFAGQDGWIIVLGLLLVVLVVGFLISSAISAISASTPNLSLLESLKMLLTRPVAYIVIVVLWIKIVVSAGLELRVFMIITQEILLPRTPMFVVSAFMLLVCGYAAAKGIETRARVAEVLLILMILPFIFLVGVGFWTSDFSNLQPSFTSTPTSIFWGILRLGFIFTGLELLLMVSPFLTTHNKEHVSLSGGSPHKHELKKAILSALLIAGVVIMIITLLTLAEFGVGILDQTFPVLSMIDMLGIPGEFIERQGALMFSFWIITAFTLGNAMLFFGGLLVKDVFRFNKLAIGVLVTTIIVFLFTLMPLTTGQIYQWLDYIYMTSGLFFMAILPVFVIVSAKIKMRKNSTKQDKFAGKGAIHLVILCLCLFLLTSCWDNVAIENRDFVTIIGIDKANDEDENKEKGYTVTLSIPSKKNDDEDNDKIKSATAETITEAIQKINTDNLLYFGHAKLVVLGNELLSEKELVENTLNMLNNHREIDLRIYVLASDSTASEIVEARVPYNKIPGCFTLDFERFYSTLKYNNGALIPLLKLNEDEDEDRDKEENKKENKKEDKEIQPAGAMVINDYKQVGKLDTDELRGFLWCVSNKNKGIVVISESLKLPLTVEKHVVRTQFTDEFAIVNIKITGRIEESPYNLGNITPDILNQIQQDLALQIKEEVLHATTMLQDEFNLNGLDYAPRWEDSDSINHLEVIPIVTVKAMF